MHDQNPYNTNYDLQKLAISYPLLTKHIILNPLKEKTIDFSSSEAVYALNKAILLNDYNLEYYELPAGYLIPGIPGRLEYLLNIKDFFRENFNFKDKSQLNGLDIGAGANAIYCILGSQHFNWKMIGSESNIEAVKIANTNIKKTKYLSKKISIRLQPNKSFLFKDIILPNEKYDFTLCNPPFHSSKDEAVKVSKQKLNNLNTKSDTKKILLNFEGQANELWCNGGEALFIKRLIKESVNYKNQVRVFSSLVAKYDSLLAIKKQLKKVKARYKIIPMSIGNKKNRCVIWWFSYS